MACLMADHPDGGRYSLRFCLIAGVECLAGSFDEPQMMRKVLLESIHGIHVRSPFENARRYLYTILQQLQSLDLPPLLLEQQSHTVHRESRQIRHRPLIFTVAP
jgi:hypothetical protein